MSIPTQAACIGKKTPDGTLIDTDEKLIDYFLDSAKVAAVHGGAFGLSPAFRVSYATSEAVLKEACVRIQTACSALR
jgi:aspartate aminotransferase